MEIVKFYFILLLFCLPIFGSNYYVSNQGLDTNSGTQNEPWQTLAFAATHIQAGDSVLVEDGTYEGFSITIAGDSLNPIVFKALGNSVLVDRAAEQDNIEVFLGHYVIIEGFKVTNARRAGISVLGYADNECEGVVLKNNHCTHNGRWGIFTGYAKNILIENNETAYSGDEHGIYVSNSSDNPVIRGNSAHHNNGSGIQINADPALEGDGIISGAIVENNICYENGAGGGAALNFASIRHSIIKNNILYDNHSGGIAMWDDGFGNGMGCKDNKIFNNTVVMPSDGRWALNMIHASTGNTIINNILLHEGSRGGLEIDASSMDSLISDYNIMDKVSLDENWISLNDWQGQSGQDGHSFSALSADIFIGNGDFHLKTQSPAIDKGQNISEVSTDFEGDMRPSGASTDIGADEVSLTSIEEQGNMKYLENPKLLGNYPNPFNGNTQIRYYLPTSAQIEIIFFDSLGKQMFYSAPQFKEKGYQTYLFKGILWASGNYYYRITTDRTNSITGRLTLIK